QRTDAPSASQSVWWICRRCTVGLAKLFLRECRFHPSPTGGNAYDERANTAREKRRLQPERYRDTRSVHRSAFRLESNSFEPHGSDRRQVSRAVSGTESKRRRPEFRDVAVRDRSHRTSHWTAGLRFVALKSQLH